MERRTSGSSQEDEERREHLYSSIVAPETLQQHLLGQLNLTVLSQEVRSAAMALIGNMDERGFFDESLSEVGRRLGIQLCEEGPCPLCLGVLDKFGAHCESCMSGGDKTVTHGSVRDDIYRHAKRAHTAPRLEACGVSRLLGLGGAGQVSDEQGGS